MRLTERRQRGLAPLFAALLAVILQALTVQTHIHFVAAPIVGTFERPGGEQGGAQASAAGDHAVCVVCGALASASRAALPQAATVAAAHGVSVETAALAIRQAPRAPAHAWRSRAPPSFL